MPELPELQAHAERLTEQYSGAVLSEFTPFTFSVLRTVTPAPVDNPLRRVHRRGKYLLADFGAVHAVVHLMHGGRLLVDDVRSPRPRNGLARFTFADGRALLLTEAGRERRAGIWFVPTDQLAGPPLDRLGPDALGLTVEELAAAFAGQSSRLHGFLRDQHRIAGLGRMLANEVCHRARLSPFAPTGSLGSEGAAAVHRAIHDAVDEALTCERSRTTMSSSAERPGRVHRRVGEACPECGDTIASVTYSSYTVAYCPTCQTGGKLLKDNTTSRFLK